MDVIWRNISIKCLTFCWYRQYFHRESNICECVDIKRCLMSIYIYITFTVDVIWRNISIKCITFCWYLLCCINLTQSIKSTANNMQPLHVFLIGIFYNSSFRPGVLYYHRDLMLSQAPWPMAAQLSNESCTAIGQQACDSVKSQL